MRDLSLLLAIFACFVPPTESSARLEKFKLEAEMAIKRKIQITYNLPVKSEDGRTVCETNPVEIMIRGGMTSERTELAKAHELGHVMSCSKGIGGWARLSPLAPVQERDALTRLGSAVLSCYADLAANAEATKRGFNMQRLEDLNLKELETPTSVQVEEFKNDFGVHAVDFAALRNFCTQIRAKHRSKEIESSLQNAPDVLDRVKSLKVAMASATCVSAMTCYSATRRLRDQFTWSTYMEMTNPKSHARE